MKATDLRIGNYVNFCQGGDELSVINSLNLHFFSKVGEDFLQGIVKPIPLTEDILLKCGFVKDDVGYYALNFETSYGIAIYSGKFCLTYGGDVSKETYIYSVHQLQNLYFALTGEELTIKL